MAKFVRPSTLNFPQIYYTFKAKDKDSDEIVEYRIQDLPIEDYERAVDMLLSDFVPEENFCVCRGLTSEPAAMAEIREFWKNELQNKISVACYRNNDKSNDLVGLNVLAVESKNHEASSDEVCMCTSYVFYIKIIFNSNSLKVKKSKMFLMLCIS